VGRMPSGWEATRVEVKRRRKWKIEHRTPIRNRDFTASNFEL
jgi:hypothetical protein